MNEHKFCEKKMIIFLLLTILKLGYVFPDVESPTVTDSQDPALEGVCKDRGNGVYQHPYRCDKYISCSNSIPYVMPCPSGLNFNNVKKECVNPAESNCLIYVGETTFGARDRSFGGISLSKLSRGKITQIKLEHVSGYVTCHYSCQGSKWGCNHVGTVYNKTVIGTVITNKEDDLLFYQFKMPGYTGNSQFIVFNEYANEATNVKPVTTKSFPGDEMRVWYKEDLDDYTTLDNRGTETIKVYVTIDVTEGSKKTEDERKIEL